MKTSLKVTALFLAVTFPVVAFAEVIGVSVPALFTVETASTAFALLLLGLTFLGDYSRRPSSFTSRRPVVRASVQPNRETHRLAA